MSIVLTPFLWPGPALFFSSVVSFLGWGCRRYGVHLERFYPINKQIAHYSQILIYASSKRQGSKRPAIPLRWSCCLKISRTSAAVMISIATKIKDYAMNDVICSQLVMVGHLPSLDIKLQPSKLQVPAIEADSQAAFPRVQVASGNGCS